MLCILHPSREFETNDSCKMWIWHSLNSEVSWPNVIGYSIRRTENVYIDRSIFRNSSDKVGYTQIPNWQTNASTKKKNQFPVSPQLKCFNFPLQQTFESLILLRLFGGIRTLYHSTGNFLLSLAVVDCIFNFWLFDVYSFTLIEKIKSFLLTLIDSCDISTGVTRLSADKRCKRSRACCSTAITNASWTALPSSPAKRTKENEAETQKILIKWKFIER